MMPKVTRIRTAGKLPSGLVDRPTTLQFQANPVGMVHPDGTVEFGGHPRYNTDARASFQAYGVSVVTHDGEVVRVVVRERP